MTENKLKLVGEMKASPIGKALASWQLRISWLVAGSTTVPFDGWRSSAAAAAALRCSLGDRTLWHGPLFQRQEIGVTRGYSLSFRFARTRVCRLMFDENNPNSRQRNRNPWWAFYRTITFFGQKLGVTKNGNFPALDHSWEYWILLGTTPFSVRRLRSPRVLSFVLFDSLVTTVAYGLITDLWLVINTESSGNRTTVMEPLAERRQTKTPDNATGNFIRAGFACGFQCSELKSLRAYHKYRVISGGHLIT